MFLQGAIINSITSILNGLPWFFVKMKFTFTNTIGDKMEKLHSGSCFFVLSGIFFGGTDYL